jgi:hypothetical protein
LNAMPFWNCDSAQLQLQLLKKMNIYGTWLFFKMKGIYRKTRTCISEETRHERELKIVVCLCTHSFGVCMLCFQKRISNLVHK